MKRKGLWNAFFVFLCIVLIGLLGFMLSWGMKRDAQERKRLEQLSVESMSSKKEEPTKTEPKPEQQPEQQPEETPAPEEPEQEPEVEQQMGIVCWGESLTEAPYARVLQKVLQENGYTDKVLPVSGTKAEDLTPAQEQQLDPQSIPVISIGYQGDWNASVQELIARQKQILEKFQNPEAYVIVGVRPQDDSVGTADLDKAMEETWGAHYISASIVTGEHVAASVEGQDAIAKAVYEKLLEFGYLHR